MSQRLAVRTENGSPLDALLLRIKPKEYGTEGTETVTVPSFIRAPSGCCADELAVLTQPYLFMAMKTRRRAGCRHHTQVSQ